MSSVVGRTMGSHLSVPVEPFLTVGRGPGGRPHWVDAVLNQTGAEGIVCTRLINLDTLCGKGRRRARVPVGRGSNRCCAKTAIALQLPRLAAGIYGVGFNNDCGLSTAKRRCTVTKTIQCTLIDVYLMEKD